MQVDPQHVAADSGATQKGHTRRQPARLCNGTKCGADFSRIRVMACQTQ